MFTNDVKQLAQRMEAFSLKNMEIFHNYQKSTFICLEFILRIQILDSLHGE